MNMKHGLVFAALVAVSVSADAHATDVGEITADEYWGAAYFKQALDHPQVAKQKSRNRQIAVVARDMRRMDRKWNKKRLTRAIDKVDGLDGDPIQLATDAIRAGFAGTRVDGRVLDVLINADEPKHVVVYVRWQGTSTKEVIKEAATIAHVVSSKAPLVSTLSLSAIHPKAPKTSKQSVWSGKIGRPAMQRIDEKRIADYADRLYKRLFEGVEEKPF